MKHSKFTKVVSAVLCVGMLMSVTSAAAFADSEWDEFGTEGKSSSSNAVYEKDKFGTDDYYTVISNKDYALVPGAATETEMVLNNAQGGRRQVIHVITVDPSNPDVSIVPGYYGIDKIAAGSTDYKTARVTATADYYEKNLNYKIVGGMNTDLSYSSNAPRLLVYNGQKIAQGDLDGGKASAPQSYLGVYKDESGKVTCDVKAYSKSVFDQEYASGKLYQAIAVSFGMTVKNGELVNKTVSRPSTTSSAASRSMVGVKEDGTLVICMNDGRGANNSIGFSDYEEGEAMLALGCKWAANCDGGGSSTFISRRAGEEDLVMRSVPSDNSERPTISSVFVVNNAVPTGELGSVTIESDYDYFAPSTTYTFGATAVDTKGFQMDMPAGATWALSDSSFGTVSNGKFESNGKTGDVDVQVKVDGAVYGSKTLHIANPTTLQFTSTSTVIPYSTDEKVREIDLPLVSKIGESDVYYDSDTFSISLSNEKAGTLNGFKFTATKDTSIQGVVITAVYVPTGKNLTYSVEFGKGSEVLFDFEDGESGSIKDFIGTDNINSWVDEYNKTHTGAWNKDDTTNTKANHAEELSNQTYVGQRSHVFLATEENGGQVKNGNASMGITVDWTHCQDSDAMIYNYVYYVGETLAFRDTANDKKATQIGFWIYIPVEFSGALGQSIRLIYSTVNNSGSSRGEHTAFKLDGKGMSTVLEGENYQAGWYYATVDLTGFKYASTYDANVAPGGNRTAYNTWFFPAFLNFYASSAGGSFEAIKATFYVDDIALDYSAAVDDRDKPVISDLQYGVEDMSYELEDGAKITSSGASFSAKVKDFAASNTSGLDASTAAIYVDGDKISTSKLTGDSLSCDTVSLGVGTHKITFEIADNMGNYATVSKTIVSNTDDHYMKYRSRIELKGHNDLGNVPEADSVYYVDVCSNYFEGGLTAEFTLDLNTANTWELDNIIKSKDCTVSYKVNPSEPNKVTFTVDKRGYASSQTVLFSIPVRVYTWKDDVTNRYDYGSASLSGAAKRWSATGNPTMIAPIKVEMPYCSVYGSYGNYDELEVATNVKSNVTSGATIWHTHTPNAISDKTPTCTEDGYTGRTYCDACGSVVDWGTTIPATGHNYTVVEGKLVCSCGDVYTPGTGLFELNGKRYYAIAGNLMKGWQELDDGWYLFDETTYAGVDGEYNNGSVTYTLDNGKLLSGEWQTTANGTRYWYGPTYYKGSHYVDHKAIIDGDTYYFDENGYRFEGHKFVKLTQQTIYQWYDFGNDGKLIDKWNYTGLAQRDGFTYSVVDGLNGYGMFLIDGAYYYCPSANWFAACQNLTRFCSSNNGLLPADTYTFGANCKMVDNDVYTVDGILSYFVKGKVSKQARTITLDGKDYQVTAEGKVLLTGFYTDASGINRYFVDGVESQYIKNGLVKDADGEIRFYKDNVPQYAGVVKDDDGNFYYINSSLKAVKSCQYAFGAAKANGLVEPGTYSFAADGKMIDPKPIKPVVVKNGLFKDEDGEIRFYVNDVPTYAGVVEDKDNNCFYYINSSLKAVKSCQYAFGAAKANELVEPGTYSFAADGKMIDPKPIKPVVVKNGLIKDEDGEIRYYVNDVPQYAGVVKDDDGNFYYINSSLKAVKSCQYAFGEAKANGLVKAGTYSFAADGKMINPQIIDK